MIWMVYFFIGLLALLIGLIWVRIKVELKFTKQEQWLEMRFLILKYRIDFKEGLTTKERSYLKPKLSKRRKKKATLKMPEEFQNGYEGNPRVEPLKSEFMNANDSDSKYSEKAADVKGKRGWLKAPKSLRRLKAPEVIRLNILERMKVSYYLAQYQRFKGIFKETKLIFYRLLKRIRIYHLDSLLHFNVDDPMLNAQLMAVLWSLEANLHRFIKQRFRRLDKHQFNIKSEFDGQDLFLETSCLVSFRIIDIIVVILGSLKEIFTIKRMINLEEEV